MTKKVKLIGRVDPVTKQLVVVDLIKWADQWNKTHRLVKR